MKPESVDYFSNLDYKKRFKLAMDLRDIYYKLHPFPKEGMYKSFANWKDYLKWKEKYDK